MYKIMIVDDESLTRLYMKKNIPNIDSRWQVICEAADGQEAIDLLRTTDIDLVITDIRMPIMDGLQLSKQISENYSNIIIVILSGHEEFSFAKEALKYGVKDYLLKPLVKDDLRDILNKLADEIEKNKDKELAQISLINKSQESSCIVIKNYLKAIITESTVEIKAMTPIIEKLQPCLINFKGVLLLLHVNEYSLLGNSENIIELSLYKYILMEICSSITKSYENNIVFLDKNEDAVILINALNREDYIEKCRNIFNNISKEFTAKTGLSLSGGIGEPEADIFHLKNSYKKSEYALQCALLYENNYPAIYVDCLPKYAANLKHVKETINTIESGIFNNDESQWSISLIKYLENINKYNYINILKYGIFLLNSFKSDLNSLNDDQITNAITNLKAVFSYSESSLTKEITFNMLSNILQQLVASGESASSNLNSNDIVEKAKQYIYNHYSEPISLEMIADKISVSYSYLSNIFHKSEGQSYIKFLTRVRMEKAVKLIKSNPKIKIYDVAEKIGYANVKYFSYLFKNYYNVTPGEYSEKYFKETEKQLMVMKNRVYVEKG